MSSLSGSKAFAAAKAPALRALLGLPPAVLRRMAGEPVRVGGRTLDPEMQLILALQRLEGPDPSTLSLKAARRSIASGGRLVGGRQPIGAVTDRTIAGPDGDLTLRFYTPRGVTGLAPALLYVHGGGWIYGDLESHDAPCRFLAETAGVRVVAVDYRLAPEYPFPAALEDVEAAYAWLLAHAVGLGIDADRLAVGGDSAGGNLATVLAQRAGRRGLRPPAYQVLIYPSVDLDGVRPSRMAYNEGFYLTQSFMDLARQHYTMSDPDPQDPRLSPLYGDLSGLPPAYVVTAGFDPLHDEGEAYAEAMRVAGVRVEYACEEGLIHSFANMVGVGRSAPAAMRRVATSLRTALR